MKLVTGGTGALGRAIRHVLPDAVSPTRDQIDLSLPESIEGRLTDLRPDLIVNCAAFTDVDRAEAEPETAETVNARSVAAMARYAARRDIPLVTFSTDYVFDGKSSTPYVESSPTNPVNQYGRTKLLAEKLALEAHPGTLVVRTSTLFSAEGTGFVGAILRRAGTGRVQVVSGLISSPTSVSDLARAVVQAVEVGAAGILHLVNAGEASRLELARAACAAAGFASDVVEEVSEWPSIAPRPPYSVLASERASSLGLPAMRPWRAAVNEALARD